MTGGRPRIDFEQHRDLIIQLYRDKTPWTRIEEILLTEHGCKVSARTINQRFKEWDSAIIRGRTQVTDELKNQIRAYWTDRSTRPKTDEELHQKLTADGFVVNISAVAKLRNEMRLYRRWDHRLGRVRPVSELNRRKRTRKQKGSIFTDAQLAPLVDMNQFGPVQPQPSEEPAVQHQPQTTRPARNAVPAARPPRQRRQALPTQPVQQPVQQPAQDAHPPPQASQQPFGPAVEPSSAMKDA